MPDQSNIKKNESFELSKSRSNKRKKRIILESKISIINTISILFIFIVGFLFLLVFKRDTVSNEENRNLASFPEFSFQSYFSGEYTEAVTNYYNDSVPHRSFFKKIIASKLLTLKGKQYGNDRIVIYGSAASKDKSDVAKTTSISLTSLALTTMKAVTTVTTTVTTVPDINNPAADGMISNNIVVVNKRGLMLFGGSFANGQEYASSLNEYKKALGKNVKVYSMVCPTAVSYYMPENYLDLTASEKENIDNINSYLSDVKPVDVFTALLYHKNENIYSRTDHHWLPLGAYYAAKAFAKDAEVNFAELNSTNYDTVSLPGYVGTLYGYTQSADLINNPEDFVYYIPKTNCTVTRYTTSFTDGYSDSLLLNPKNMSTSSYYMVFGGDEQITQVNTSCKNARTLVIFKDSYGNALVPMLTSSFENIYVCDMRYFDLNAISFIQQVGATDVLFAMNTFSATGGNHDYIEQNRVK